jgi:hypothetical protein
VQLTHDKLRKQRGEDRKTDGSGYKSWSEVKVSALDLESKIGMPQIRNEERDNKARKA